MKSLLAATTLALAASDAGAQDLAATLSPRDRALVTFAALMTRHEADTIGSHAALALDAGVTAAELSETITHLAFYTGWGNAIMATEAVAPIYATHGVTRTDLPRAEVELLPLNTEAEAAREANVQDNFGTFSPDAVDATREVLFHDLWLRPDLAPRDRSLVTVAALIAAGQPEQMTFHVHRAMDNGLTKDEAGGVLQHLAFYAGWPRVFSALPVARSVFDARGL